MIRKRVYVLFYKGISFTITDPTITTELDKLNFSNFKLGEIIEMPSLYVPFTYRFIRMITEGIGADAYDLIVFE